MLVNEQQVYEFFCWWVDHYGEERLSPYDRANWEYLKGKYAKPIPQVDTPLAAFDSETQERLIFYRRLYREGRLRDA